MKRELEARRGSNQDNSRMYMVNDTNNYKNRLISNMSPSNADLIGGVNGMPLGQGYFHHRNASMDVASLAAKKKPVPNIKAQIVQRKR